MFDVGQVIFDLLDVKQKRTEGLFDVRSLNLFCLLVSLNSGIESGTKLFGIGSGWHQLRRNLSSIG